MTLVSSAPTRIDMAGGTLDIFPLYIFLGGGITVNAAIDLRSNVKVRTFEGTEISIRSIDMEKQISAPSLDELTPGGALDLIIRAIRFFSPKMGLEVVTESRAPKGSGLGASSSLLVALTGILARITGVDAPIPTLIDWCANIEAQSLGIPTGKQDYYAAFFGGLSSIFFEIRGTRLEQLSLSPRFLTELKERTILSFTGVSHFSGTNNWNMMKRFIDKEDNTVENLERIGRTAARMRMALLREDFEEVAAALNEEWENRRLLAEGVSTRKIDSLMEVAQRYGALASKICGAGGGGCMVTLTRPGRKEQVACELERCGARVLDFSLDAKGLETKEVPD